MVQNNILCACGCGREIKESHTIAGKLKRFIHGHNSTGRKVDINKVEEIECSCGNQFKVYKSINRKYCSQKCFFNFLSKKMKGRVFSLEHRRKISLARLGKKYPNLSLAKKGKPNLKVSKTLKRLYAEGKLIPSFKGKHHSEETKLKISNNKERNLKISLAKKGKKLTEETKLKLSLNHKGKHNSSNTEFKKGQHYSPKTEFNSKIMKERWQNPEYREKRIKENLKGLMKRPTSFEKIIINLINKHNLPYKYTGDGSFLIGYKNPDFINCNGEKIAIEVYNKFHHPEDYEQKRSEHFAKYGWKTIFVNEDEIKSNDDNIILNKIKNGA